MADSTLELLRELTEAPGISGYEQEVREIIRRHLQDITNIEQDRLGSIVCRKNGKAEKPRIMLAGHMDEIGFIVKTVFIFLEITKISLRLRRSSEGSINGRGEGDFYIFDRIRNLSCLYPLDYSKRTWHIEGFHNVPI